MSTWLNTANTDCSASVMRAMYVCCRIHFRVCIPD